MMQVHGPVLGHTAKFTDEQIMQKHTHLSARIDQKYQADVEKLNKKAAKKAATPGSRVQLDRIIAPVAQRVVRTPPTTKKGVTRDPDALYEVYADTQLMVQKLKADGNKHNREQKAHENIIIKEHNAHENRVVQLCVNERHHIERMYRKAMDDLNAQRQTIPTDQYTKTQENYQEEKAGMLADVNEHSRLLAAKFHDQEQLHSNLFAKIESFNDSGRTGENIFTEQYNEAKTRSYQDNFIFGVKLENPEAASRLIADRTATHGDDFRFSKRTSQGRPLLQHYRHIDA